MSFVNDHQLPLILACFLLGSLGATMLFRRRVTARAWKIADLVWVCLGGIGAITAVIAGVYTADSSRLDRQIDLAYAASGAFDRDAARFRLAHCETDHPSPAFRSAIRDLCEKVEFLSASTAGNSALPLFIAVTERAAPLSGLRLFGSGGMAEMEAEVARFEPASFLAFVAEDDVTRAAVALLRAAPSTAGIAGEYLVIARSYEELIEEVMHLGAEWDYLQSRSGILTLQVLALCLVAFAAPFRLGKSVVDLM
ncbi:hypothetical protein [Defluviimonas sp. SAOS-178_SWC]|uniref:hypothetical protein n=1 Tax=Defluviimonas sp. SAOS-178_SWC TaxID=3121287 RepID=UPI003222125D